MREFGIQREGQLVRTDVYRWAERWRPPDGPVNVFVSPPFADLEQRPAEATDRLRAELRPGDVVLVKGSLAVGLAVVAENLTD